MIKDSGERREFTTGAVRDIAEGKGRCDLLPLDVVGELIRSKVLLDINHYIRKGSIRSLETAIGHFAIVELQVGLEEAMLEAAIQYEEGCKKYGERNWEKGINLHCYIDSAVRHYLKWKNGYTDEPHDRAFLWNILGAIWTHENKPELIDLPFAEVVT